MARDLCFNIPEENGRFNYRVVAVIIYENHLLIHKQNEDAFWGLPGGRCGFMESSEDAICREMEEELGVSIEQERLLWSCENFFRYESKDYHELSFYYLFHIREHTALYEKKDFIGIESYPNIQFRWIPIANIEEYDIKPAFLIEGIQNLPNFVQHIIFKDIE